jgi:putative ABC transport system ATP-binding protein
MSIFHRLHQERGITVVLVTHEPSLAAQTERIVRLRDGSIIGDELLTEAQRAQATEEFSQRSTRGGAI